ncbi:hypothetical protein LPJ81_004101, partial [Coemansia sp. IMI 209127]
QWVAVGNESSSGVISLTSTDTEDELPDSAVGSNDDSGTKRDGKQVADSHSGDRQGAEFQIPIDAQYRQQKPLEQQTEFANYPQPQAIINSASRWDPEYGDLDEQQAVHLLRESVASLLSSGGTASSAASSALSGNPAAGASGGSRRRGSSRIISGGNKVSGSGAYYRQSHSPGNLSKISEPCYHPSSEPRKRVTANFDHFSDIALSSTATPPFYQHQHNKHDRLQAAGDSGNRHRNTQFPTFEEFKRQQQQQQTQSAQSSISPSAARRRMNVDDSVDDSADADTIVPMSPSLGKQKMYAHPLLSEHPDGYSLFLSDTSRPLSPTTAAAAATGKRSPFASIRAVSPIIVHRPAELDDLSASEAVMQRAQAEAALEQTILCPIKRFNQFGAEYHRLDGTRSSADKRRYAPGDDYRSDAKAAADNIYVQGWARYTSYAIVGFGVGTLVGVGMLYFDMAVNATPKATRTIPIAGF